MRIHSKFYVMTVLLLVLGGIFILGIFWHFYFRVPRPKFPPLNISNDDPIMAQAIKEAKDTIGDFLVLFKQYPNSARVKVPFTTSDGQTEFLWSNVKAVDGTNVSVFLMTPPVTHTGQVDRNQVYQLTDIVDWTISREKDKIEGGYSMRAMFKIARDKWGALPDELLKEEKKYH